MWLVDGAPAFAPVTDVVYAANQTDDERYPIADVCDFLPQLCLRISPEELRTELAGRSAASVLRVACLLALGSRSDLVEMIVEEAQTLVGDARLTPTEACRNDEMREASHAWRFGETCSFIEDALSPTQATKTPSQAPPTSTSTGLTR